MGLLSSPHVTSPSQTPQRTERVPGQRSEFMNEDFKVPTSMHRGEDRKVPSLTNTLTDANALTQVAKFILSNYGLTEVQLSEAHLEKS